MPLVKFTFNKNTDFLGLKILFACSFMPQFSCQFEFFLYISYIIILEIYLTCLLDFLHLLEFKLLFCIFIS